MVEDFDESTAIPMPPCEWKDPRELSKAPNSRPVNLDKLDVNSKTVTSRQKAKYFLKVIDPLPWNLVISRTSLEKPSEVRMDLVSGFDSEKAEMERFGKTGMFTINNSKAQQLCHFHPLSPMWAEGSIRSQQNAEFFRHSHQIVRDLDAELDAQGEEIRNLKEEIEKLKGEK